MLLAPQLHCNLVDQTGLVNFQTIHEKVVYSASDAASLMQLPMMVSL
jgi:hypothetical protein